MPAKQFVTRFLRLIFETSASIFSNLGASAIDGQQYKTATVLIGLAAAATAARSTAEHYLSTEDCAEETSRLTELVKRYGGLKSALQAIADGQISDPKFSPSRAAELLALSAEENDRESSVEGLIVYVGKWIEEWAERNDARFEYFASVHQAFVSDLKHELGLLRTEMSRGFSSQGEKLDSSTQAILARIDRLERNNTAEHDLERAISHFKRRRFDVAIAFLEELESRSDVQGELRFRVLKYLGHAYGHWIEDPQKSAQTHLRAVASHPDASEAKTLEGLAKLNLGDKQGAYEAVVKAIRDGQTTPLTYAVFVLSAPEGTSITQLETQIPDELRRDVDVASALSRFCAPSDLGLAEKYARLTQEAKPENPYLVSQLAQIILESEQLRMQVAPDGSIKIASQERVKEAQGLLKRAIAIWDLPTRTMPGHLRLCLGLTHMMLGQPENADTEFARGYFEDEGNPEAMLQYALSLLRSQNTEGAVDKARQAAERMQTPRAKFFLAHALLKRDSASDRAEAIELFKSVVGGKPLAKATDRLSALEYLVRALCLHGRAAEAVDVLGSIDLGWAPRSLVSAFDAIASATANNKERAVVSARDALANFSNEFADDEKLTVAEALERSGLAREALTILRPLVRADHIGPDTFALLRCSLLAHDDRFILDFCRSLRHSGNYNIKVFEIELATLSKYSGLDCGKQAFAMAIDLETSEREKQSTRLLFSIFALSLGEVGLVERDVERLPLVADAKPWEGEAVVRVIASGGDSRAAVDYAYALSRRFPLNKSAVRAVIRSFLRERNGDLQIPKPTAVERDSAFCLQELDGPSLWYTIEENAPDANQDEISPGSPRAAQVLGKSVGTRLSLTSGLLQDRMADLTQILHRTVRRFQAYLDRWETLFPDDPFIVRITIKTNNDGEPDVTPVYKSLDQKQTAIQNAQQKCRERGLPVLVFAQMVGGQLVDVLHYVAMDRGLSVRVCLGSLEERLAARKAIEAAPEIVLAPSSLAMLYISGVFEKLGNLKLPFVVTRGALAEYKQMLLEAQILPDERGALGKIREQYVFIETTKEQIEAKRTSLQRFVKWIESQTRVLDGLPMVELDAELRESLTNPLGRPFLEAVGTAKQRGALLCEEEHSLGLLASQQFGGTRVWLQVVLLDLCEKRGLPMAVWHEYSLFQLQMRFAFTSLMPDTISVAGERTNWHPWAQPFTAVIDYLGNKELSLNDRIVCWGKFLGAVWKHATPELAAQCTIEGLRRLAFVSDGLTLITESHRAIYYVIDDAVAATKAWIVIYRWLSLDRR